MISIKIEHKHNTFNIKHPEMFNECDKNQFLAIMEFAILKKTALSDRIDDQILLMQELLRTPVNKYVKNKWYRVINDMVEDGVLAEILELQNFIFKDQIFNNWLIKSVLINKDYLTGPLSRFSYMKFGEFISADMLFMGYFDNKNEEILNKFIAVLYRKPDISKVAGDKREDFESTTLEQRSLVVAKLDEITKQAILFNYAAIRHWLADKYKAVFNNNQSDSKNISFGNSGSSWLSIRKSLAGDVFNLDKVDNLFLHDVLDDLNEKIK